MGGGCWTFFVWLVLLLAQARLEVLTRLRRDDLLLREGQAGLFSGRQATFSVSQPMLQGATEHLDGWFSLALLGSSGIG